MVKILITFSQHPVTNPLNNNIIVKKSNFSAIFSIYEIVDYYEVI
jgi:hypothetical protein